MCPFPKTSGKKQTAYQKCLKLLSSRNYSRVRLREKLLEQNYSSDEVEEVLDRATAAGLLREDWYIAGKISQWRNRGYAPELIRKKLQFEGLDVCLQTIEDQFAQVGETTQTQIQREIRKKAPLLSKIKSEENWEKRERDKSKILSALLRKGHSFGQCQEELRLSLQGEP